MAARTTKDRAKDKAAKDKAKAKAAKDKAKAAKDKAKQKAAKDKAKEKAAKEKAAKAKEKAAKDKAAKEKAAKAAKAAKAKDKAAKDKAARDKAKRKAAKDKAKEPAAKDESAATAGPPARADDEPAAADEAADPETAPEPAPETAPEAAAEVAPDSGGEASDGIGPIPDNDRTIRAKGYLAEALGREDAVERVAQRVTLAASYTTRDHDVIRAWAQSRGGRPADVTGTGTGSAGRSRRGAGVLRIEFPDGPGDDSRLEEVDWSSFFATFDDSDVDFLYQERVRTGDVSRFHKFVRADA